MYSPGIGQIVADMGEEVRFRTCLPNNLLEIGICMVGRFWQSQFEFWAHTRMALNAGVSCFKGPPGMVET